MDTVDWSHTARILEANIAPPNVPDGYGCAVVRMTVENTSAKQAAPGTLEVVLEAGGWRVSHRDQLQGRVRIPDSFVARDLKPGDVLSANLGFWVPTRAASDPGCVLELRVRAAQLDEPTVRRFACNPGKALSAWRPGALLRRARNGRSDSGPRFSRARLNEDGQVTLIEPGDRGWHTA